MATNRGVAYLDPVEVAVQDIDFPKLKPAEQKRKCNHGLILKVLTTNICGSDQHMVRGRTTAPLGLILGHDVTGEVIEAGGDVEFIKVGDVVSVSFNMACGRCRNWKEGKTGNLSIRIGLGWIKSCGFAMGQCPVRSCNRPLMMAILHDKIQIAKATYAQVISLDEAPQGYKDFDQGAGRKFIIEPHSCVA